MLKSPNQLFRSYQYQDKDLERTSIEGLAMKRLNMFQAFKIQLKHARMLCCHTTKNTLIVKNFATNFNMYLKNNTHKLKKIYSNYLISII